MLVLDITAAAAELVQSTVKYEDNGPHTNDFIT